MYIALRPIRIAGHDYRVDDEIPDEYVTHRLEVTGFVKHIEKESVKAPVLTSDGSITTVELTVPEIKMALIFLQQTPAVAAKSVTDIDSQPLLDYLKQIDSRKAVQTALDEKMNGGETNGGDAGSATGAGNGDSTTEQ